MSETDGEVQVGTFGCYGETVKSSLHKITKSKDHAHEWVFSFKRQATYPVFPGEARKTSRGEMTRPRSQIHRDTGTRPHGASTQKVWGPGLRGKPAVPPGAVRSCFGP